MLRASPAAGWNCASFEVWGRRFALRRPADTQTIGHRKGCVAAERLSEIQVRFLPLLEKPFRVRDLPAGKGGLIGETSIKVGRGCFYNKASSRRRFRVSQSGIIRSSNS